MTNKEFILNINSSNDLLQDISLEPIYINNYSLNPNKSFNEVALDSQSPYDEIYLRGLSLQYYNIILKDYSYFQFNYQTVEELPYLRLAFFPNPFKVVSSDIENYYTWYQEGSMSFEDFSQAISEYQPLNKRPPIRYDLSYKQYKKILHPTAHFHFGNEEDSRIGTDRIYSPLLFTMFISKMFYHGEWAEKSNELNSYQYDNFLSKEKDRCNLVNFSKEVYYCEIQDKLINLK